MIDYNVMIVVKNGNFYLLCVHKISRFLDCSSPNLPRIEPNTRCVYDIWLYSLCMHGMGGLRKYFHVHNNGSNISPSLLIPTSIYSYAAHSVLNESQGIYSMYYNNE